MCLSKGLANCGLEESKRFWRNNHFYWFWLRSFLLFCIRAAFMSWKTYQLRTFDIQASGFPIHISISLHQFPPISINFHQFPSNWPDANLTPYIKKNCRSGRWQAELDQTEVGNCQIFRRSLDSLVRLTCEFGEFCVGVLHQLIGSSSHYLQLFFHSRWLFGISSINSSKGLFLSQWKEVLEE